MSQCVCCGTYIPEGSQICRHCSAVPTEVTEFMGLPIKEVIDLITVYKCSPKSCKMTKDYVRGYKAGYRRCYNEFDEAFGRLSIKKKKEDKRWMTKIKFGRRRR